MTLSEFMNGFYGYMENQQFEQRQAWERSRFIVSGLVKDPPSFPWEEGTHKPYTEEELKEIVEYHEDVEKRATRKQILTEEGWKDVSSGS